MQGQDYIDANRRAWDQVAPIHAEANQARLLQSFAQPGYSTLDSYLTAKLRQIGVAGKDVAQLACNNGRELLSVKNMGARRCVGFDISAEFMQQAVALNHAAGQDCEFVATSIYEIPAAYNQQFDMLFVTIGVLSWMPDIAAFFAVVARLLRPGGHLLIYEMHPFLNMLAEPEMTDRPLEIALNYFSPTATEESGLDYYTGRDYDALPNYWFAHPLSAILMGVINNGMALVAFEEYTHDISTIFHALEPLQKIPLSYILVAQKV